MTPMIDIVFLLIIFFLTVSQITKVAEHPLNLPRVPNSDSEFKTVAVTLNLDSSGVLYIGGKARSLDQLRQALQQKLGELGGSPERMALELRCDRECDCRHVNRVVVALSELGFQQIRYAVTNR